MHNIAMGKLTTAGWTRLDEMIAAHGEDGTLALIATRMAEGESMKEIALSCGMTVTVIRRWLEDNEKRREEVALARRCFAEELVYAGLREARDADIETVALGKYRTETFMKMAGKLDRVSWGEKVVPDVTFAVLDGTDTEMLMLMRDELQSRRMRVIESVVVKDAAETEDADIEIHNEV